MPNPQVQNALTKEIQAVAKLRQLIFELKELRVDIETHRIGQLNDAEFNAAIQNDSGNAGELSHMTAQRVRSLLAAMDALDAVLTTPRDLAGVTTSPLAAMSLVIR